MPGCVSQATQYQSLPPCKCCTELLSFLHIITPCKGNYMKTKNISLARILAFALSSLALTSASAFASLSECRSDLFSSSGRPVTSNHHGTLVGNPTTEMQKLRSAGFQVQACLQPGTGRILIVFEKIGITFIDFADPNYEHAK
jgi:hypothetical protein